WAASCPLCKKPFSFVISLDDWSAVWPDLKLPPRRAERVVLTTTSLTVWDAWRVMETAQTMANWLGVLHLDTERRRVQVRLEYRPSRTEPTTGEPTQLTLPRLLDEFRDYHAPTRGEGLARALLYAFGWGVMTEVSYSKIGRLEEIVWSPDDWTTSLDTM